MNSTNTSPVREAIILAGGLGTRLRSVVSDLPKCMAPVAGRPFLYYVINQLRLQGVERFIFSLGYKHEYIGRYLAEQFPTLQYECSIEDEPLGTGGAIRLAMNLSTAKSVLIANGDTLFKADLDKVYHAHQLHKSACTLALKPMQHFDRYGVVEIDANQTITAFHEKKYYEEGLINGGIYLVNANQFRENDFPEKFSFEKDYLEQAYTKKTIHGVIDDGYFIDIGIPEDFQKANTDLKRPVFDLKKIDQSWTLFLDRDGVINHDKVGCYIFNPDEFRFYDQVPEAMQKLATRFGRLIIATSQRGVGRGLRRVQDLTDVHQKMRNGIEAKGGRLDAIFYASSIDNKDRLRKPNPGMALEAKRKFPEIDFSRSVMVGNNISDMQFGRNAGMFTVFLTTTQQVSNDHPEIDLMFESLPEFAKAL